MSFDMNQADEDPHGECRHEIERLREIIVAVGSHVFPGLEHRPFDVVSGEIAAAVIRLVKSEQEYRTRWETVLRLLGGCTVVNSDEQYWVVKTPPASPEVRTYRNTREEFAAAIDSAAK